MAQAHILKRDISKNSCLVFKTATHQFKSSWHSHREFEIVYIESGCGSLQYGCQLKEYSRGDLFLLGPWIPHEFLETSNNHISISLLFNHDFIMPGFLDCELAREIKLFLDKTRFGMVFQENRINVEIDIIKLILSESGLEQAINLLFLLKRLSSYEEPNLLVEQQLSHCRLPKQYAKIQDIMQYINRNSNRKLLIDEVASKFYMSNSHFSRLFSQQTGINFTQYLLSLRINKACDLLAQTDLPITHVSQEVGFESLSSFNRTFIKIKGVPPRSFRKQ